MTLTLRPLAVSMRKCIAAPTYGRVLGAPLVYLVYALRCAGEKGVYVEPGHGRGQESYGREDREAAAHVGGYGEYLEVLAVGYLLQEPLLGVRRGDRTSLEAEVS